MMMKQNQKGATLIIVLFALLLITIVGVLSVRQSTTDLAISTSAQVEDLLFQGSDAALAKLEESSRRDKLSTVNKEKLLGSMLDEEVTKKDAEVVLCVRPQKEKLYYRREVTRKSPGGGTTMSGGFCNLDDGQDYASLRKATATQMTLVRPSRKSSEAFDEENRLSNLNDSQLRALGLFKTEKICVYAVTVLPAYADATTGSYTDPASGTLHHCMQQPISGTNSVASCLEGIGVPYHYHLQEYEIKPLSIQGLKKVETSSTCAIAG